MFTKVNLSLQSIKLQHQLFNNWENRLSLEFINIHIYLSRICVELVSWYIYIYISSNFVKLGGMPLICLSSL